MKMKSNLIYLIITIIIINFFNFNSCQEKNKSAPIPEEKIVTYEMEDLIPFEYTDKEFEGLNKPLCVRMNPVTNELVVLDYNDHCLYIFTEEGKYIKKVGQRGQGPGDLMRPKFIDIDSKGNIYVYEFLNKRISIFDRFGKFINSFRIPYLNSSFVVTDNEEVVLNFPGRNHPYYFTIYSPDGEIINEIGEITKFTEYTEVNVGFARGTPIVNENGNYVIFLQHLPEVKKFDSEGNLLLEKSLDDILELHSYPTPENQKPIGLTRMEIYHDIIYRNNSYFLLDLAFGEAGRNPLKIYNIDEDFNIINKIILPNKSTLEYIPDRTAHTQFEVTKNSDILVPFINDSELYRYFPKKQF